MSAPYGASGRPVAVKLTKYELEKMFKRAWCSKMAAVSRPYIM